MLWLTWRQHRMQVLVTAGLLLVLGGFLLMQGMENNRIAAGLAPDSEALKYTMSDRFRSAGNILGWLPLAAALIGLFWGAPVLAREFERGTHTLAWTQSVSRRRWLVVKLGTLSAAVALCGLALGAMIKVWLSTFPESLRVGSIDDTGFFAVSGVVPAAWWLFLFVVGTAAGTVFRKLLPAMAVTIAVFAVTLYVVFDSRVYYATPERLVQSQPGNFDIPAGALITGYGLLAPDGRELGSFEEMSTSSCFQPANSVTMRLVDDCLFKQGYREVRYYHPSSRYWQFQWTETGLLAAGALVLCGVTWYRVIRRRA